MADPSFEKTQKFCDQYAEDIHRIFPNTKLHYILYKQGQKADRITRFLPKIADHPAYREAASLLKFKSPGYDQSVFLGMVVGFRKSFLNLKKNAECLAFILINLNQYETQENIYFSIHSLTAQFLETLNYYSKTETSTQQGGQILQPKRNHYSNCRLNLKCDVYSVLQMAFHGFDQAAMQLAKQQAYHVLTPQTSHPEDFIFPLATDVTEYAIKKFRDMDKRSIINSAYNMAHHTASSFNLDNFDSWIHYVNNAQTLAWNGFVPQQILHASINSAANPFMKSIGYVLAEILNIEFDDQDMSIKGYNPFALPEVNLIEHERSVEETFEMVLVHSLEADSHLPLIHVANNQNDGLIKGKFSGWCAHALQSAASAYSTASQRGMPRDQAARLEFHSAKQHTDWKTLSHLGEQIVSMHRDGQVVTLSGIAKWCEQYPQFKAIMESINLTLTNPVYSRKLEMAAEMPGLGAAPAMQLSFAPEAAPRHAAPALSSVPQHSYSFPEPAPGGGGRGGPLSGPRGGGVRQSYGARPSNESTSQASGARTGGGVQLQNAHHASSHLAAVPTTPGSQSAQDSTSTPAQASEMKLEDESKKS